MMGDLKEKLRTRQRQGDASEIGEIAMDTHGFRDVGCAFVCMGRMDANGLRDRTLGGWIDAEKFQKFCPAGVIVWLTFVASMLKNFVLRA